MFGSYSEKTYIISLLNYLLIDFVLAYITNIRDYKYVNMFTKKSK
jgi:hypothetical protein